MPIETLVEIGFYSSKPKLKPCGIEIWNRVVNLRDEHGEWEQYLVPTLAICLPNMAESHRVQRFSPSYWEESEAFYWGFKTSTSVAIYCCLDLLDGLLDLPCWQQIDFVPLRWNWQFKDSQLMPFVVKQIDRINSGRFSLNPPPIPPGVKKHSLTLAQIRHFYTPYDYEWQTGKKERDEAKEFWNKKIKEVLIH